MAGFGEGHGSIRDVADARPGHDPLGLVGRAVGTSYEIEALSRRGGLNVVYRATHRLWQKSCAIKVFDETRLSRGAHLEALRSAFVQEAALLAELSSLSTSVVQAWDVGTLEGPDGRALPYVVLEWLEGSSLDVLMDQDARAGRARWTLLEVHELLSGVVHALEIAHQRGIVHRDIKPENLFVVGEPRTRDAVTKLLDFGVAKVMDDPGVLAALAQTGASVISFTPEYGAPEQFDRAFGATGPWTDVHALGLLITELVTGQRPLAASSVVELGRVACDPLRRPTPAAFGMSLPNGIEEILARAVALDPSRRYRTAGEFWQAFTRALASGVFTSITLKNVASPIEIGKARPPAGFATQPSLRKRHRARRVWLGAAGSAVLLAGAAAGGLALLASAKHARAPLLTLGSDLITASLAGIEAQCPKGMARLPAGQFYMGADGREATEAEKPSFHVTLDAFCIDLTEVTTSAYAACSAAGRCRSADQKLSWPGITPRELGMYQPICNFGVQGREQHPINSVDHKMAAGFCEQRGARLPTEAEWEYATRGPDGRIYPWGDEAPQARLLNGCGRECARWADTHQEPLSALYEEDDGWLHTSPVASFAAGRSRFGLYDVAGNVWEWVADWYAPYTKEKKHDPHGPARGERRVIRGGAWNGSHASWLRPSFRYGQHPEAISHGIGFRCAWSLPSRKVASASRER